jgi:hypothetical protein
MVVVEGTLGALTLLVHERAARLRDEAAALHEEHGWPTLSASRIVAEGLIGVPAKRRSSMVEELLGEALEDTQAHTVVVGEIGLLFEPALSLDPMTLFRRLASRRRLVVCWPGSYHGDVLAYAVPEHEHYRTWKVQGAQVIRL